MRGRIDKTPNCGAQNAFRQGRKNLTKDSRPVYPGACRMLRRRIGGLRCSTEVKRSAEVVTMSRRRWVRYLAVLSAVAGLAACGDYTASTSPPQKKINPTAPAGAVHS